MCHFIARCCGHSFLVVKGFSELHCWADCTYFRWREMASDWMKYIIIYLMKQLLNTVKLCCPQVNRHKVTLRSNKAKIVQCSVLSCLFQAHWCKPPFSFSTVAFTGSERRSDGTELGKITVNHSHKPLRIRSCSNGITPLIQSRNFWAFFFLLLIFNEWT